MANIDLFKQEPFYESPIVQSQAYFAMGDVMKSKGKYREALTWLIKAVEADNNYADAWVELGLTKFKMGDNIGAIVAWSKAHEVAPDYPLPLYNLARIHDRLRKYDVSHEQKAIHFYKEYLAAAGKYHEVLLKRRDRIEFSEIRLKTLTGSM